MNATGRNDTGRAGAVRDAVVRLRRSGLLAATVPTRLGGPELPASVIAEVCRILASGDGSLGQIPQSHMTFSRWLFTGSHPHDEERWARRLLDGTLIANAQAEETPVVLENNRLNGRKVFCTGSAYADVLAVTARHPGQDDQSLVVFLPVDAPGVTVLDDWTALGQEYTTSGTVILQDVEVGADDIRHTSVSASVSRSVSRSSPLTPPAYGAFAQLLHTAIDVGISGSALDAALEIAHSRDPDPLTAHVAGELVAQQFAAEAVLEKAGRSVDEVWSGTAPGASASLDVAAAKAVTGALTVDLASRIFELTGTGGATGDRGQALARHWRDLRTHTLHDRRREKLTVIGRAALSGDDPVPGRRL
ncbi:acyl-CoA dehydrogenase family protein [Corynebacterium glyciniphilum]|uniref:acyl-CoA dehydrogenase family protein n=1 Tax=Corynebacterium glyciniphilum TaxID=1404244 RepID=UPI0011AB32C3|nr:acyl-CoA dehydrogenase family protein [Corynebacterium glyciniphilum]